MQFETSSLISLKLPLKSESSVEMIFEEFFKSFKWSSNSELDKCFSIFLTSYLKDLKNSSKIISTLLSDFKR